MPLFAGLFFLTIIAVGIIYLNWNMDDAEAATGA